jgi:hypothetical protein
MREMMADDAGVGVPGHGCGSDKPCRCRIVCSRRLWHAARLRDIDVVAPHVVQQDGDHGAVASATAHAEACAQRVEAPQRVGHVAHARLGARQTVSSVGRVFVQDGVDEAEVANGTLARGEQVERVWLASVG